jgi:hypothetical protein
MIKYFLGAFFFFLIINFCKAQSYTIHGVIEDAESGERLPGANIYNQKTNTGTTSNIYGFYSLTLPKDSIELIISFVGFSHQKIKLFLEYDTSLNFKLSTSVELKEIEIVADKVPQIQNKNQMSSISISTKEIASLPVMFGEKDLLKMVLLLPGVKSGGEGTTNMYVRGGGPDQNLILLDGVPVYNVSHLFGFFSVFNPDAIQSVELIKGGFPARYGGRLSSVLDIRMKEGNNQKFSGEISTGIVATKFTLEGPIIKGKTSFIISARRTLWDLLSNAVFAIAATQVETNPDESYKARVGYYFYDLNLKINHKINDNNRLFLSLYNGLDKGYIDINYKSDENDEFGFLSDIGWGNLIGAFRWNSIVNSKLFCNTTLTYSRYKYFTDVDIFGIADKDTLIRYYSGYISGIYDIAGKVDFDYMPSPKHTIRFGGGNTFHTFTPGVNTLLQKTDEEFGATNVDTSYGSEIIKANEIDLYAEDEINFTNKLNVNFGLHLAGFFVKNTQYFSPQPRLSARYLFAEKWSAKASYVHMAQYLHLLTNTNVGLPTDLWVPVTDTIKPQIADQIAVGIAHTLKEKFELSIEAYYKYMQNLIEYKDGATYVNSVEGWESKVEMGKGDSYGLEFLLQKKEGKYTGWLGYTLSWANRQFTEINYGEKFPYRYDKRHDIGFTLTYHKSKKIDYGVIWVYSTGKAVTLANEKYYSNSSSVNYYGSSNFIGSLFDNYTANNTIEYVETRNNFREPAYHRLDLAANFHKVKKHGTRTISIGIYNVYFRANPYYLTYLTLPAADGEDYRTELIGVSFFRFVPYLSYSFKF